MDGNFAFPALFLRVRYLYLLFTCWLKLSNDGVAEPRIIGILKFFALMTARSLAEYLKPSCCLYEISCSSSTTINPRFLKGAKMADLVPRIILVFDSCIFFHVMNLSFSVKPE